MGIKILVADKSIVLQIPQGETKTVVLVGDEDAIGLIESNGKVNSYRLTRAKHYIIEMQGGEWVIALAN